MLAPLIIAALSWSGRHCSYSARKCAGFPLGCAPAAMRSSKFPCTEKKSRSTYRSPPASFFFLPRPASIIEDIDGAARAVEKANDVVILRPQRITLRQIQPPRISVERRVVLVLIHA